MSKIKTKEKVKAIGLLSGGLDSTLAVKLILDQGIDVITINCSTPFCLCDSGGRCHAAEVAKEFNLPIRRVAGGEEYLDIVRNPKHGYGRNMNPCIDCRIFILNGAKEIAKKEGAKFIFTGEVLDQRPMSQHNRALREIEEGSRLKGKLLRPLSAKLLPCTEAENKGWVLREKLLGMKGRSRKPQMALAEKLGVSDYPCPGGGCMLTYKEFADKLRDLFKHESDYLNRKACVKDVTMLKFGRHLHFGKNKIIVGRNENENKMLTALKNKDDYTLEAEDCMGPITILQGPKTRTAIETAAKLTARYSDSKNKTVLVGYGTEKPDKKITVSQATESDINKLRIR
jgi:tRNA U34 2-thiouridine synthase MnmA/TrmU